MDLVKKMVEATEAAIEKTTSFKKVDFSLGDVDNVRQNYDQGFMVKPTTLEQAEGGVGFLFFRQGFEINLFEKLSFRGAARQKIFDLYSELEKLFQDLYTIRVAGDNYAVLNIDRVASTAPLTSDNYVALGIVFSVYYRRTHVF